MLVGWALLLCAAAGPPPAYPQPGAQLTAPAVEAPEGFRRRRIYLDAGHGVGTNTGARTVACTDEADFVLDVCEGLAQALEASGDFEVVLSRTSSAGPGYKARAAAAAETKADLLLSVHADSRGEARWSKQSDGQLCLENAAQPGFSVLFSDEGHAERVSARRRLARVIARRLLQSGLPAYDGFDYTGLYVSDDTPGVFVDRRGLFMLRRPKMPSVIIETMHALHPEEWARWQEPATRAAFHGAVLAALYDFYAIP